MVTYLLYAALYATAAAILLITGFAYGLSLGG